MNSNGDYPYQENQMKIHNSFSKKTCLSFVHNVYIRTFSPILRPFGIEIKHLPQSQNLTFWQNDVFVTLQQGKSQEKKNLN